jgi:type IV pilus assembly protein PilF
MKKISCSIFYLTLLVLTACSSEPGRMASVDDFDKVKAAKTRVSLGLTYLKNGNFSQAKFNLDKALQFAPRLADAHFSLAYYYQQVEEHVAAEGAYQKAMELAPDNADIANSYGAFLCGRGKYSEAKRYFLKAVNSESYISSAETYENLALCSRSHGEMGDALEYLRSAVNHQPGRAKSLFMLAEALVESDMWLEAKDVLRRYERVSQVSARSLLLASQIERALGNVQKSEGYGAMLLRMYPVESATEVYRQQIKALSNPPVARKSSKRTPLLASKTALKIETQGENLNTDTPEVLSAITNEIVIIEQDELAPKPSSENTNTVAGLKAIKAEVVGSQEQLAIELDEFGPEPDSEKTNTLAELTETKTEVVGSQEQLVIELDELAPEPASEKTNTLAELTETKAEVVGSQEQLAIELDELASEPASEKTNINTEKVTTVVLTQSEKLLMRINRRLDLSDNESESAKLPAEMPIEQQNELVTPALEAEIGLETKSTESAQLASEMPVEGAAPMNAIKDTDLAAKTIESADREAPSAFHIVQKSENLYRISLLYNVRMQRLKEWNKLSDSLDIYQGKKLRILAPEKKE